MNVKSTKKLKRIYWLCEQVSEHHLSIAMRLQGEGHGVQFFSSFETLLSELSQQRVPTIVIGDEGDEGSVARVIMRIAALPEAQGIRLILSVSKPSSILPSTAACHNFRDIIPVGLSVGDWLERFLYASGKAGAAMSEPVPQIAYPQVADLALPGRLVWISDEQMLFEARFQPPVGTTLTISGKFPDALGLKRLTLTVTQCRRTDLLYRFSDAVIARWNAPAKAVSTANAMLAKMRQNDFGPRIKVFIAAQSADIRGQLIRELEPLKFEVNVALQKQSIVDEPKFFSPQVVFIEDKLCVGDGIDRFRALSEVLAPEVPIVVIGTEVAQKDLQILAPLRRIIVTASLPERLSEAITSKFLPIAIRKRTSADANAVNIASDHPFSMVEVHFSARVTKMHPRAAQLALPFAVGTFGLCRVETPEFKRAMGYAPYAKILSVYRTERNDQQAPLPFVAETYLCDTLAHHQVAIAKQLMQYVNDRIFNISGMPAVELSQAVGATTEVIPPFVQPDLTAELETASKARGKVKAATLVQSEKVAEIDIDFIGPLRDFFGHPTTRLVGGFLGFSAFVAYLIYLFATVVAPNWNRSGGSYTESLKKFAPGQFERSQDLPESEK